MDSPNVCHAVWGFKSPLGKLEEHKPESMFDTPPSELYDVNWPLDFQGTVWDLISTSGIYHIDPNNDIYTLDATY